MMIEHHIDFQSIEWEKPKNGVEQKVYSDGNRKIRLLRFRDDFIEDEWCLEGHVGYVLAGEMTIDFNGRIKTYKKGDGLWIKEGKPSKHKAMIEKGKQVELILFEVEK